MATIGSAKATLVDKIDSLTASATAKDTIYLAKALKENTTHHSFTYLGAWAATTAYAVDDVVITGGQTYICKLSHVAPGSFVVGAHWDLLASKGTDGSNGANGTTVGTGTAGQVLKTNSAGTGIEWGADEGGGLKAFNYAQSGSPTSFGIGNNDYPRESYIVQITTESTTDLIHLNARMSWSCSDNGEELGASWYYRNGTSGSWTRLTAGGAVGDTLSGKIGTLKGQHGNEYTQGGYPMAAGMDIIWIPGSVGTFQMCPGISGNGNTGSTIYENKFADGGTGDSYYRYMSSCATAGLISGGIL